MKHNEENYPRPSGIDFTAADKPLEIPIFCFSIYVPKKPCAFPNAITAIMRKCVCAWESFLFVQPILLVASQFVFEVLLKPLLLSY